MEGMEIEVGRAEKFSQNARITFISYIIVAVPRITLIQWWVKFQLENKITSIKLFQLT